jgi:hypothetical protein
MSMDSETPPLCYRLRIDMLDSDPPIWRSLWVWADTPLADLPTILAAVMGWSGQAEAHLHLPNASGGRSVTEANPSHTLSSVLRHPGDSLRYTYAPALGWLHRVALEAVELAQAERLSAELHSRRTPLPPRILRRRLGLRRPARPPQ